MSCVYEAVIYTSAGSGLHLAHHAAPQWQLPLSVFAFLCEFHPVLSCLLSSFSR